MDHLRTLFDRALGDEPPSQGDLAREAMTSGRRLRHRRRLIMGGGTAAVVAVFATVITVSVSQTPTPPPAHRTALSLAMEAACAEVRFATDSAAVFLRADVTDQQRYALDQALRSDPRVRAVRYVSKAQAYARFAQMYRDSPELVDSVPVEKMPEAFDVRLTLPSGQAAFIDEIESRPGVEWVSGAGCREATSSVGSSFGDTE